MGRLFGGAATDKIQASGTYTWPTLNTWGAWVYRTGAGGGSLGYIFQRLNVPTALQNNGGSYRLIIDWTGTDGQWDITRPSDNAWHHICFTYDGSLTSNDPLGYVDGVSVTVSEVTAPTTTYGTGAATLVIGNNGNSNNRNFAGMLAEVVHYNVVLTPGDIVGLMRMGPLKVRPANRLAYYPLIGRSPEPDFSASNLSGTLTGTTVADHAPTQNAFARARRLYSFYTAPAGGGATTKILLQRKRRIIW